MSDGTPRSDELHGVPGQPATVGDLPSETMASAGDWHLIGLLRSGDEAAFVSLIESYHIPMLRLATVFVTRPMVAEEVVQETWMAVLEGLPRFEGR
ncbi:MAG TPA: sigma factor, partial [Ktedonobacteraceae bacterium]|nr:sigma factor [Ktedonobacteraceae bacterium]